MDMNSKIHKLYEKYNDLFRGQPVAFDGVVDEDKYLKTDVKIAFLLKDVNGEETKIEDGIKTTTMISEDWEYVKILREEIINPEKGLYKTWPNACLWIEVFRNSNVSYMDCLTNEGQFDENRLRNHMLEVAIVNIKKTPGGGSSNYDEIRESAITNKELLLEEFDILAPQLIICGGTFEFAKLIYDISGDKIMRLPSGAEYFKLGDRVFLEFVHPMWYTVPRKVLFSYAKVVFGEIKAVLY